MFSKDWTDFIRENVSKEGASFIAKFKIATLEQSLFSLNQDRNCEDPAISRANSLIKI